MTPDPQISQPEPESVRRTRSERLLTFLAGYERVVVVSHVNPDPDSLASMLGIKRWWNRVSLASRSS